MRAARRTTTQTPSGAYRRAIDALFSPVDASALAWFRIVFGVVLAWEALRYLLAGWVQRDLVEPALHFTYYPWDFVRPLPGPWMIAHVVALLVLALALAAGLWTRVSALLFAVGFCWFFLVDQALYLNHLYLVCLLSLILVVVPASRCWSVAPGGGQRSRRTRCRPGRCSSSAGRWGWSTSSVASPSSTATGWRGVRSASGSTGARRTP